MTFDVADANNLIKMGAWESTIMHEMGHVLGLGTLWDSEKLITPKVSPPPFSYLGENGNLGLDTIAGLPNQEIVIEDQGGAGTARSHWSEAVYDTELMTGYLEGKNVPMPLSLMTVRALQDLGYTVDVTKADPYVLPSQSSGRRLRKEDKIPVGNDILDAPVIALTESGENNNGVVLKVKEGREEEYRLAREKYASRKRTAQGNGA